MITDLPILKMPFTNHLHFKRDNIAYLIGRRAWVPQFIEKPYPQNINGVLHDCIDHVYNGFQFDGTGECMAFGAMLWRTCLIDSSDLIEVLKSGGALDKIEADSMTVEMANPSHWPMQINIAVRTTGLHVRTQNYIGSLLAIGFQRSKTVPQSLISKISEQVLQSDAARSDTLTIRLPNRE